MPDYPLDETLDLDTPEQYRALFEDTRLRIVDLLGDRAATTCQLADVLGRSKGTIGHHIKLLAEAGLVHVVGTEKVRAIEAKYYGRTARTFNLTFNSQNDGALARVVGLPNQQPDLTTPHTPSRRHSCYRVSTPATESTV